MLVVRLGAMGDVLHAMPAVAALRTARPHWRVGWVIEPRWLPLLRAAEGRPETPSMPLVHTVHVAAARGWARRPLAPATWRAMAGLRTELRNTGYDLAIDLQGAVRSALIGRASGAELVGEEEPRERVARLLFDRRVPTRSVHVIGQAAEVISAAAGARLAPQPSPPLPVDPHAQSRLEARLGALLRDGAPIALLHPGAGWGAKRWPAVRYGEVGAALAAQGYAVLANRAPGEEAIAEEVIRSSGGRVGSVSTDLAELIALTRHAALVIGGDTGPLHLACALGRPVVGIFGPTDPSRNGPWGAPFRVVRHPESRRDHSRRAEPEAGLLAIAPDEVLAAAIDLLANEAARAAQA